MRPARHSSIRPVTDRRVDCARLKEVIAHAASLGCWDCLANRVDGVLDQRQEAEAVIYGAGTLSCGRWLADRKSKNDVDWLLHAQWILGWVSSAGYYGQQPKETDSQAIDAWVDDYCTKNPLENLNSAARELVDALRAK